MLNQKNNNNLLPNNGINYPKSFGYDYDLDSSINNEYDIDWSIKNKINNKKKP